MAARVHLSATLLYRNCSTSFSLSLSRLPLHSLSLFFSFSLNPHSSSTSFEWTLGKFSFTDSNRFIYYSFHNVSSERLSENFPLISHFALYACYYCYACCKYTLKTSLIFSKARRRTSSSSTIRGRQLLMHPFRTGKDRVNVIVLPALRLITANCHPFKWKTFGGPSMQT